MKTSIRSIPDYPGLFARADGVILRRTGRGLRPRRTRVHKGGECIRIKKGGRTHERAVARLVLAAFVGPCPPGHRAAHLDRNPLNNRLANLAWTPYGPASRPDRRKGARKTTRAGRRRKPV